MRGSPFIAALGKRATDWEDKLINMQDIMDIWMQVQSAWMYLEPIFNSEDIMRQMPVEGKQFKGASTIACGSRGSTFFNDTSHCNQNRTDRSNLAHHNEKYKRRPTCHPVDRLSESIDHTAHHIRWTGKSSKRTQHLFGEETHIFCPIFLFVERRNTGNSLRNKRTETRSAASAEMLWRCKLIMLDVVVWHCTSHRNRILYSFAISIPYFKINSLEFDQNHEITAIISAEHETIPLTKKVNPTAANVCAFWNMRFMVYDWYTLCPTCPYQIRASFRLELKFRSRRWTALACWRGTRGIILHMHEMRKTDSAASSGISTPRIKFQLVDFEWNSLSFPISCSAHVSILPASPIRHAHARPGRGNCQIFLFLFAVCTTTYGGVLEIGESISTG